MLDKTRLTILRAIASGTKIEHIQSILGLSDWEIDSIVGGLRKSGLIEGCDGGICVSEGAKTILGI